MPNIIDHLVIGWLYLRKEVLHYILEAMRIAWKQQDSIKKYQISFSLLILLRISVLEFKRSLVSKLSIRKRDRYIKCWYFIINSQTEWIIFVYNMLQIRFIFYWIKDDNFKNIIQCCIGFILLSFLEKNFFPFEDDINSIIHHRSLNTTIYIQLLLC